MKYDLKHSYHVAVPTAFHEDESLNIAATIEHILYLQSQKVSSVLVCGTTGEQHSLSLEEKRQLVESIEKEESFHPEFEIIFGISSIRQQEAMSLTKIVSNSKKISGVLVGFSPYIIPNQQEAKIYIKNIAQQVNKPVIIYNNPRRTGFDLSVDSANELFQLPIIIGIKEAGEPTKVSQFIQPEGKAFYIYAGGEDNLAKKVRLGFTRLSSIGGNVFPSEIKTWFNELLLHQSEASFCYQRELDNIFATSPLPALKKAIKEHGKIDLGVCRSPLGN